MGLFGKSKRETELEAENKLLKEMLASKSVSKPKAEPAREKQVVWQCRLCGCKETRLQSRGMPNPGFCLKNGRMGGPKGPHIWRRIMVK